MLVIKFINLSDAGIECQQTGGGVCLIKQLCSVKLKIFQILVVPGWTRQRDHGIVVIGLCDSVQITHLNKACFYFQNQLRYTDFSAQGTWLQ